MFSDTIEYTDFDGNLRKETLYFNISQAEAIELEMRYPGGYVNKLQRDIDRMDQAAIMQDYKDFIQLSYGVKSDDGRKFLKSREIFEDFKSTEAYSEFYMKFLGDPEYALKFIVNTFPTEGTGKSKQQLEEEVRREHKKIENSSTSMIDAVVAAD